MFSRVRQFRLLSILSCLILPVLAVEPRPDIRVAIDISGSMKQNDPHSLRTPALKMLVGLMPDDMYAGVWTFGQFVNMQVKHGRVDAAWKARARRAADQIHSRGKFTNIEEAIQRASFNWLKADARFDRSLILLTDGMVDITRDADVNRASRQRILEYWIPRLKKAKVRLHSVALSKNVDKALLHALSDGTGGWYEQVDSAEQLQRVFLRLFEKSVKRDSVPLKGNGFHIDAQIEDMTLLVFHQSDAPALKITTPAGKHWREQDAPGTVTWFHEAGYDLITVSKPAEGDWQLETTSDPDNRVLVVTNLKLKVDAMPEHLLVTENIEVVARLMEKDKAVSRADFLKLVEFSVLDQKQGEPDVTAYPMQDNGKSNDGGSGDGSYGIRLSTPLAAGEHTLLIRADGATFQREKRHTFHVYDDVVSISLEKQPQGFALSIEPQLAMLDSKSIKLTLQREDEKETQWKQEQGVWHTQLPPQLEDTTISIDIKAKRRNGELLEKTYTRELKSENQAEVDSDNKDNDAHLESSPPDEKENEVDDEKMQETEEEKTDEEKESNINWSMTIWLIVFINLSLALIGVILWIVIKKRRSVAEQEVDDEMKL